MNKVSKPDTHRAPIQSNHIRMFDCTFANTNHTKQVAITKARRMVESEVWENERRDRGCLEDLGLGEFFTDTHGNRWERTK